MQEIAVNMLLLTDLLYNTMRYVVLWYQWWMIARQIWILRHLTLTVQKANPIDLFVFSADFDQLVLNVRWKIFSCLDYAIKLICLQCASFVIPD